MNYVDKYKLLRQKFYPVGPKVVQRPKLPPKPALPERGTPEEVAKHSRLFCMANSVPDWLTGADRVVYKVCSKYDCTLEDIRSDDRTPHALPARHELWYLLRHELEWSYAKIGRYTNHNHTSVMHALGAKNGKHKGKQSKKALARIVQGL